MLYLCTHILKGHKVKSKHNQNARVAQLVEHDLAKVGVASSNLVSRSKKPLKKGFVVSGKIEYFSIRHSIFRIFIIE